MYTSIYRPKRLDKIVGHKNTTLQFINWLLKWSPEDKQNKCLLVSGLCGIGKSLLVELVLCKHNYNAVNMTDGFDKDYIKSLIKTPRTINGQLNALIMRNIDTCSDYGFISSLVEYAKETLIPIICICDNRYDQSIKPLLPYCCDLKLTSPSYQELREFLTPIISTEKINIKETQLKEIYDQSKGDVRFILNAIQFGSQICSQKNIQSDNIFETSGKILSIEEDIDAKYNLFWTSNDLHPLFVQENYVANIMSINDPMRRLENIAYSADALSDLDMFQTFIGMANWEFEPYVAVSTINAASKCNKKTMLKFPQYLGKISSINRNKRFNYESVNIGVTKNDKKEQIKEKKPRGRPKKTK